MLSFAADSGSIDSCVVLTVELRERELPNTPAFARSAAARCVGGMGLSPSTACGESIAPRLSNETRESIEDALPRWTFVSTNPDVPESVLPLDEGENEPSSS